MTTNISDEKRSEIYITIRKIDHIKKIPFIQLKQSSSMIYLFIDIDNWIPKVDHVIDRIDWETCFYNWDCAKFNDALFC